MTWEGKEKEQTSRIKCLSFSHVAPPALLHVAFSSNRRNDKIDVVSINSFGTMLKTRVNLDHCNNCYSLSHYPQKVVDASNLSRITIEEDKTQCAHLVP